MILGLVLARGGSKRLPNKNLRYFFGQPLVTWAVGQGLLSQRIDDVAVSSDSEEILDTVAHYPIHTIRRPPELATDECTSYPPILHALDTFSSEGIYFDWLCLLQPTSPLRTPEDIDECIGHVVGGDAPAIASYMRGSDVPNGAIYVGRVDWLRDGGNFDGPAVRRFDMPPNRSVDIDTEEDWEEAEAYIKQLMYPEEHGLL